MPNTEQMFERGATNNDKRNTTKVKKRILVTFFAIIALIIAMSILVKYIDSNNVSAPMIDTEKQNYIFYTPDFSENIMEDEKYLSLDRNIYLYDISTGVTEAIDISSDQPGEIRFMLEFVYNIICGRTDAYNASFNESLYEMNLITPKHNFTMQKLYNIKITRLYSESSTENNYTKYFFALEYMISENNGTFRTDIGSDGSKIQYITLLQKDDGKYVIDSLQ